MDFVKKHNVKAFFRRNKVRVSEEIYETMNAKLEEMFNKAIERAKRNRRGTVMEWDL